MKQDDPRSAIVDSANQVRRRIDPDNRPQLLMRKRRLSNVHYNPKAGYFKLARERITRTLTCNTVKSFPPDLANDGPARRRPAGPPGTNGRSPLHLSAECYNRRASRPHAIRSKGRRANHEHAGC